MKAVFCRSLYLVSLCVGLSCAPLSAVKSLAADTSDITTNLQYNAFIHGYHVVDITASYAMSPWGYAAKTHLFTVGMASWFLNIDLNTAVQGRFEGGKALPISYDNQGISRHKKRHVHLNFDSAGLHITTLTPPENNREPLPPEQLKASIDILSALGELLYQLQTAHSCHLAGFVFDGVRLMHIAAHGPVNDTIPTEHQPYYAGAALRCDFTGRQTAGFVQGSPHKAAQASPHPGSAWLKVLKDGRVIPVRVEFQHPKLGRLVIVLHTASDSKNGHETSL